MKKFYDKYSWLIIILLLALVFLRFCNSDPKPVTPPNLIPEVIRKDSFRTVIRYHDSTRIKTVIKHRELVKTILKDSTACYTEVLYVSESCEDVIAKDSILISSLYGQHKNDSILFVKSMAQKNDTISLLKKEIRKQKWQKRGIIALWVIREGVGVANKVKP